MATVTTADQASPIGSKLYTVTETSTKLTTASTLDTTAGTVGIIQVEIDNTANTVASYLNLYDVGGGVTVTPGTTDETFVFMAPAGGKITYSCPGGSPYASGLKAALVSAPGGPTGPSSTVVAYVLVNTL